MSKWITCTITGVVLLTVGLLVWDTVNSVLEIERRAEEAS